MNIMLIYFHRHRCAANAFAGLVKDEAYVDFATLFDPPTLILSGRYVMKE